MGYETPLHNEDPYSYAGSLSFNADANVSTFTPTDQLGGYTFSTNSAFTIAGSNGSPSITGTITSGSITPQVIGTHQVKMNVNNITGVIVPPELQSYYGLNAASYDGFINLTVATRTDGTQYISFGYIEIRPVPIPAAGWLLGTGIIGLLGIRRKMRS